MRLNPFSKSKSVSKDGDEGIVIIHDLKGDIIEASDGASGLLGYSREELCGMNVRQLFSPGNFSDTVVVLKDLIQKGKVSFDGKYEGKDGKKGTVSVSSTVYESGGGKRVKAVITRKQ